MVPVLCAFYIQNVLKCKCQKVKHGDFSTCDVPRPGRPKTVTTSEIIDLIH
jgi:hypothetical protein